MRSPLDVIADVSTWPARLEAIAAGLSRDELEHLAGNVSLFSALFEPLEKAVLRRRQERQEAESKALELALRGPTAKESKGPGRSPGALREPFTHTGPHPEGSYAPRT